MKQNKIYAVKKGSAWWAVIDCGETKEGGMAVGNYWSTHFKKNGRTYRWYDKLFYAPFDIKEWQEISVITKQVTVVDAEGHTFEGWNDTENLCYETLQKFANRIGKPMSIEDIKALILDDGKTKQ